MAKKKLKLQEALSGYLNEENAEDQDQLVPAISEVQEFISKNLGHAMEAADSGNLYAVLTQIRSSKHYLDVLEKMVSKHYEYKF